MKRLLIYSHDTYGLGNIRRMLAIGESMAAANPDLVVLIASGSPVPEMFQVSPRIDFVKLPCLTRDEQGEYRTRSLGIDTADLVHLRSSLLQTTVESFRPDVIAVDKKPFGVCDELRPALQASRSWARPPKLALILRDILDAPDRTRAVWHKNRYFDAIVDLYESVLVLGCPTVFDMVAEYDLPPAAAAKVEYCGYLGRRHPGPAPEIVRRELGVAPEEPLVLVTPGGGQDGYPLTEAYLRGLGDRPLRSVVVIGPEMAFEQRQAVRRLAEGHAGVTVLDSFNAMVSLMDAADVVVSMAGYNTVCEILTTGTPAVVAPRSRPVAEQAIRAHCLEDAGVVRQVSSNPTPVEVHTAISAALSTSSADTAVSIDLEGAERVEKHLGALLGDG